MNTFGSSLLQFPLVDPLGVRRARARFRRDDIQLLDHTNSLYVPTGRYPARGWVLLPRKEYAQLDSYSTTLQLNIGDPTKATNVGTLKNLSVVQAQCVTRGLASDDDALYLIELTDARGVLHNQWFSFPLTTQYNIRAPAYPQTFHPASLNGGTTWTWSTMLQDMWVQMGAFLGAWPGLPAGINPAGTPEGFWFSGVPALPAMCEVLGHLGLTIACDLTSSSPYTIVDDGADDPAFTALQAKYATNLEDDQEWIDTGSGRVPKTIKVLFRRRNDVYGTEETVRYDLPQWDMAAYYTVSVSAPATFARATGTHYIWSDYTIRYDQEGNPLGVDVAVAQRIAAERVTQYFDRIYSRTNGYMSQTYTGALPFTTGSQVDGVFWYQTQDWYGWRTKIVRGDFPQFDEYSVGTVVPKGN